MSQHTIFTALAAIISYWLGGISPAIIIARLRGFDLFGLGSGNPGATNAGRIMGVRTGVAVALIDVAKGALPVVVARLAIDPQAGYLAGLFVVLGHVISPYLKFKGGKGVATSLGVVLAAQPMWLLIMLPLFAIGFGLTRKIGIGSVLASFGLLGCSLWWADDRVQHLFGVTLAVIVLVRHHRNVRDLISQLKSPI